MEKARINHDGLLTLEQPMLKAPVEQLKKTARTSQRYIDFVMNTVTTETSKLNNRDTQAAVKSIDEILLRLQNLKRKLAETKSDEAAFVKSAKARLVHLDQMVNISSTEDQSFVRWNQIRLDRILVDYFLRKGFRESAKKLAVDSNIEKLVDIDLFAQNALVEEALRKRSCTEGLRWCSDNRSNLEKMKSTLEFQLRLQEYIELVRNSEFRHAIEYARKYLISWQATHLDAIQAAMGLLAFKSSTVCQPYKDMFDETRWDSLVQQFRSDNYTLHSLTPEALLITTLQAGLSALKTPSCYNVKQRAINCPVCDADTFGVLAESLPNAHHVNSCIVDPISGAPIDEDNPALVLPNGYIYGDKSLIKMACNNNDKVTCVHTGETFDFSCAKRAFIF